MLGRNGALAIVLCAPAVARFVERLFVNRDRDELPQSTTIIRGPGQPTARRTAGPTGARASGRLHRLPRLAPAVGPAPAVVGAETTRAAWHALFCRHY